MIFTNTVNPTVYGIIHLKVPSNLSNVLIVLLQFALYQSTLLSIFTLSMGLAGQCYTTLP
jgi:hypothetical protein